MEKGYSYKEYSDESVFTNLGKRVELKEYRDNLIFYNSCNTNTSADFAYNNKIPTVTGTVEDMSELVEPLNNGSFGQYLKVTGSLMFDKENFSLLKNEGCLKFRLGSNVENARGYQKIPLPETFEISTDTYSFNLKVGNEDVKEVSFNLTEGMTRSDILNIVLVEIDPSYYRASVDVSDLTSILISSEYVGDAVVLTSGTTGVDFLSIFPAEEPMMPNAPSEKTTFLSFNNTINNNGRIDFSHYKDSILNTSIVEVNMYDNFGVLTTTLSTLWNNDINKFYSFEFDFNDEVAYLFLNGILVDFKPTNFIRDYNDCVLQIQGRDTVEVYPYNFDEIILYSKQINCRSYSVETVPLTKYTTSIPYVDFVFSDGISEESVEQMIIDASNNVSFILYVDDVGYYYLSGSWRTSDGSFSMSTDLAAFEAKILDFPFDITKQIKIRAYFESDGVVQSYVEDIRFILNDLENGDLDAIAAILLGSVQLPDDTADTGLDLSVDNSLTITTDKGVVTLDFSELATIPTDVRAQEIVNIINAANIPGISRAALNSLNQLYLVGTTRGKDGYISVSGSASPIIFGSATTAIGEDAEEESIDYSPLFDYVKRRLGYPTVPVEITDSQMEDILRDAINLYNKWRNYSEKILYVDLHGTMEDGYEIPAIIGSERNIVDIIFKPRTPFGIYDSNSFEYNIYIQQLFNKYGVGGARTGFLTDYSISMNFIADSNLVLGTEPRWEIFNKRIHIYPKPPNGLFKIGIKYKGQMSLEEVMTDSMVKLWMTGTCRKLIGSIRSTFGGTLNAGETTLQMNGSEMIQTGQAEIDQAEKEMRQETLPLGFFVG